MMMGDFLGHLSMKRFLQRRDGRDLEKGAAGPCLFGVTHHRGHVAVGRPKVVVRQAAIVSERARRQHQVYAACQQVTAAGEVKMLVLGVV